jgi:hypothetical protein
MGLTGNRLTSAEMVALYHSCLSLQNPGSQPITDAMLEGLNKHMISLADRYRITSRPSHTLVETSLIEQEAEILDLMQSLPTGQEESEEQLSNPFLLFKEFLLKKMGMLKKIGMLRKPEQETQGKWTVPSFVRPSDLVTPSGIQIFPSYVRIDGEQETEYSRTLALFHYPRSAYPGWLDRIIQIDQPNVDFSVHITPHPPEVVTVHLGRKLTQLRGALIVYQRQGQSPDPTTKIALQDVEELQEKLARGDERVFSMNVFIRVRGRNQKAVIKNCDRIVSKVRSQDFRALPTHWQHHLGLLSCLPTANNVLVRTRLFGTGSAGTFFPFTGSDISMETGVMFGVQANGGLIIINPFNSKILENANMVVFAKSGSGKSFFLKTVSCRLLSTCNVYVVDPEAEYQALCERVSGQYVRLSTDSLQINPFELYASTGLADVDEEVKEEEGNFFREKLLNLITLLELLLSDQGVLPQMEKAFLYQCLIKTYENRGITMDAATQYAGVLRDPLERSAWG